MVKIGVTGGIGSGKSTVCTLFAELGVAIYDSDRQAKELMNNDRALCRKITALFGEEAYTEQGLNRAYIAQIVFRNPTQLTALNALIHPAVGEDFSVWSGQQTGHYVIQEAAILFESGAHRHLDKVVNVEAPEALRIARTCKRDGSSEEEVHQRMRHQLSDIERRTRADYTILADGTQSLSEQVFSLHQLFCVL